MIVGKTAVAGIPHVQIKVKGFTGEKGTRFGVLLKIT